MSDSRTTVKLSQDHPVYLSSSQGEEDKLNWIQESLVLPAYDPSTSSIIENIYVEVGGNEAASMISNAELDEFAAWEAASDEALLNFENELE